MILRIVLTALLLGVLGVIACGGEELCKSAKDCQQGQLCKEGSCSFCSVSKPSICGDSCVNLQLDVRHCGLCSRKCAGGFLCSDGLCRCPGFQESCSGKCVETQFDNKHCGACGVACKSGESCIYGQCYTKKCEEASPFLRTCQRGCVDVRNDLANCGKCGQVCRVDQQCVSGKCICVAGQESCDGKCRDLSSNWEHCGKCGDACESGRFCAQGQCVATCPKATPNACFGGCFDLQNSQQHCGKCGRSCQTGETCKRGMCQRVCSPPQPDQCGSVCVDLKSNERHCGSCNRSCSGIQGCKGGLCVCPNGTADCKGICANTQKDVNHCGGCGKQCAKGEVCDFGKCELSCDASQSACAGSCVNKQTDRNHCGTCGHKCPKPRYCHQGACICYAHLTLCGGRCTSLLSDNKNCGTCGTACKGEESCVEGKCSLCPAGSEVCGQHCCATPYACDKQKQVCVNVQNHPLHCGKPNFSCGGKSCCDGGCVDLLSEQAHCGACGVQCPSDKVCAQGKCSCLTGETICSGKCVDVKRDRLHCGVCGKACPKGHMCKDGRCVSTLMLVSFGGVGAEREFQFVIDGKGNMYGAGVYTKSFAFGKDFLPGSGARFVFVFAIDNAGRPIWAEPFPVSGGANVHALKLGSKGELYILGRFSGTLHLDAKRKLQSKGPSNTMFLLQFNKNRQIVRGMNFPGGIASDGEDLALNNKGDLFVYGSFRGKLVLGSKVLTPKGKSDLYVMKLNKTWKIEWLIPMGGTNHDKGSNLVLDHSGHIYVSGFFLKETSFGGKVYKSKGYTDTFVVKLEPSKGGLVWVRTFGARLASNIRGMASIPGANEIYVTGFFNGAVSFGKHTLTSSSTHDAFVIRLDGKGDTAWAKAFKGSALVEGEQIIASPDGFVYATGSFYGEITIGKQKLTSLGNKDVYLTKLHGKDGSLVWSKHLKGPHFIEPTGLLLNRFGEPLFIGSFATSLSLETLKVTSSGDHDMYIGRVAP